MLRAREPAEQESSLVTRHNGMERIGRVIGDAMADATELLAVQPYRSYVRFDPAVHEPAVRRDQALLDRGGRIRALYQHTLRHAPSLAWRYERLSGDVEARSLDEITDRLVVVDREVAFIPAGPERSTALEIRHPAIVAFLVTTFDRLWHLASPMYPEADRQPTLNGVTPRQRAIAALLVEGHTDAVIADRLGMNIRTAREHIAKLAAVLGSSSRAQLGYLIGRSGILDQGDDHRRLCAVQPRLGDPHPQLRPARRPQRLREARDVGPAGADADAQAFRDDRVLVALREERGDGLLAVRDALDARVGERRGQRDGEAPQALEDRAQVLHQRRVPQLQRHRALGVRGDEGDRAVEEDQPLDDLVQRPRLHRVAHQLQIAEQPVPVPGDMGVQVPHPHAPPAQRHRPVQALRQLGLPPDAAGLDGQHLGGARLRRLVHRGLDAGQSVQHTDRGALREAARGRHLAAQTGVPLEGGDRRADPALTRPHLVVHAAQQPGHDLLRGGRDQPVHVVRVGVQQGELHEAGDPLGLPARQPSAPYGPGVHAVPGLAQSVSTVRMLVRPVPGHRPSHPRYQRLPQRNYARPEPAVQHGTGHRSGPGRPVAEFVRRRTRVHRVTS